MHTSARYLALPLACSLLAACASSHPTGEQSEGHPPRAQSPRPVALEPAEPAASVVRPAARRQASPTVVSRFSIGSDASGGPIHVYRLSAGPGEPDAKPGLLVVAGLNALHTAGPTVARSLVDALDGAPALDHATLYVLPLAAPGLADAQRAGLAHPGGTATPHDDDRDGRTDEDAPRDLNGDGVITMIRVADPPAEYGLDLTHLPDPDEPRLMRKADADKRERATHAMLIEGVDADGDGRFAEDGVGGVLPDRNFPYQWPELDNASGAFPLSQPATGALADWLLRRPNILATLVYGEHDTLADLPPAGQYDQTGRVPEGIEREDKPLYEALAETFEQATGLTKGKAGELEGSFVGWAYAHLGLAAMSTRLWQTPEPTSDDQDSDTGDTGDADADKPQDRPTDNDQDGQGNRGDADADQPPFVMVGDYRLELTPEAIQAAMAQVQSLDEAEQRARMEAFEALPESTRQRIMAIARGMPDPQADADQPQNQPQDQPGDQPKDERTPPARGGGKGKLSEEARWLAHADERGEGFVDWTPVDHPQLGEVEVGGFVRGFKLDPPPAMLDAIADKQAELVADLLGMLPRVVVERPVVERLGESVWRVAVTVRNEGDMPTRTAMGVKARRLSPHVLTLELPQDRLLSGDRVVRVDSIAAGGHARAAWVVAARSGSTIEATLRTEEFGPRTITITLAPGGTR